MGFIAWIVFGAIAGALGKLIMPGRDPGGIIVTILIGMAGAIVGASSCRASSAWAAAALYGPSW